ncbi:hypothetical protein BH10ACI2_BH10ACI2_21460 [soil metagenome]
MRSGFQYFLITTIVLLSYSAVFGCSCSNPSLRQKFRAADSVFVGEVTSFKERKWNTSEPDDLQFMPFDVDFAVEKQWKGQRLSEVNALADLDIPGMCGDLDLQVGKRFLIFAPRKFGRLLIYRDCGPNREAQYSEKEIKKLNTVIFRFSSFLFPFPKL